MEKTKPEETPKEEKTVNKSGRIHTIFGYMFIVVPLNPGYTKFCLSIASLGFGALMIVFLSACVMFMIVQFHIPGWMIIMTTIFLVLGLIADSLSNKIIIKEEENEENKK